MQYSLNSFIFELLYISSITINKNVNIKNTGWNIPIIILVNIPVNNTL